MMNEWMASKKEQKWSVLGEPIYFEQLITHRDRLANFFN